MTSNRFLWLIIRTFYITICIFSMFLGGCGSERVKMTEKWKPAKNTMNITVADWADHIEKIVESESIIAGYFFLEKAIGFQLNDDSIKSRQALKEAEKRTLNVKDYWIRTHLIYRIAKRYAFLKSTKDIPIALDTLQHDCLKLFVIKKIAMNVWGENMGERYWKGDKQIADELLEMFTSIALENSACPVERDAALGYLTSIYAFDGEYKIICTELISQLRNVNQIKDIFEKLKNADGFTKTECHQDFQQLLSDEMQVMLLNKRLQLDMRYINASREIFQEAGIDQLNAVFDDAKKVWAPERFFTLKKIEGKASTEPEFREVYRNKILKDISLESDIDLTKHGEKKKLVDLLNVGNFNEVLSMVEGESDYELKAKLLFLFEDFILKKNCGDS